MAEETVKPEELSKIDYAPGAAGWSVRTKSPPRLMFLV